jgi:hypothetical protein
MTNDEGDDDVFEATLAAAARLLTRVGDQIDSKTNAAAIEVVASGGAIIVATDVARATVRVYAVDAARTREVEIARLVRHALPVNDRAHVEH